MKLSLRCDAETALRTIEDFLRTRHVEFEKKVFRTRIGLRKVEYKLEKGRVVVIVYLDGVDVKIPRNLKELARILSVYEIREEKEIREKDIYDLKIDLQIYERKLKLAKRGIVVRVILLIILISVIKPILNASTISFFLFLMLLMLAFPEVRAYCTFAEPSEWSIPLLLPYYAKKVRELKERLNDFIF